MTNTFQRELSGSRTAGRAFAGFALLALAGSAVPVAAELLVPPGHTANAVGVAQLASVIAALVAVTVASALYWPSLRRPIMAALVVVAPVSVVVYWLPAAWILGSAGVALAWVSGALLPPDVREGGKVERACGVASAFAALAWLLLYGSIVVSEVF